MVAWGLLPACDDDLGRDRYLWDSGPVARTTDAARTSDRAADDTVDVADASTMLDTDSQFDGPRADGGPADVRVSDVSLDGRIDALNDASESGTLDWGDAGAVRNLLLAESPACLACAQATCPSEIVGCSTIAGIRDGGPEAGLSRSQLCVETLQCLLATDCEAQDTSTCYCGPKIASVPDLCSFPGTAEGVCKATLERSLESTDPKVILASMLSTDRAGGWAMLLTRCLRDNACMGCFPSADAGVDAKPPSPNNNR
jgi:hypothetical protein